MIRGDNIFKILACFQEESWGNIRARYKRDIDQDRQYVDVDMHRVYILISIYNKHLNTCASNDKHFI